MKGTINLKKGIMIDGAEVKELTYDTEKVTVDLYLKALSYATQKAEGITGMNVKLDAGAHLAIGMYAIIAENPKYDITDIERISGFDINQVVDIGLSFIVGREEPTAEPSEEQSEATQKRTTRTSSISEE